MLSLTHTVSKSSSMATLAHSLACPDHVFSFLPPQIMAKSAWPRKAIPRWPHHWPILIMFYLVVHHHWINPRNILYICHSIFGCLSNCFSSGIAIPHSAHTFFCTFASFSVSFDLIWQPGSLIIMDGTIRSMRPNLVVLTLPHSFHV